MKKPILGVLIGSTLAAALPSMASATNIADVFSNITGMQLWLGNIDVMTSETPGYFHNFAFAGTVTDVNDDGFADQGNLLLTGEVGFRAIGLDMRLTFDLNHGDYAQGSGITFTGGNVAVDLLTSSGWIPFETIDAATTHIGFLANQPGHWADTYPGQTTAGIVRNKLPGLWDGQPDSAGFNRAASTIILLGMTAGLYLDGSLQTETLDAPPISLGAAEVPVPAAAWLFGSGLAGLAGAGRLRRRSA